MKKTFSLVGAGPGDSSLITLKALKALENADVVLYDALVNEEVLSYCKKNTEKIFVGKRAGTSVTQKQVNEIIVKFLSEKDNVVRLKGGDPFIFGRGFEELSFVKTYFSGNVSVEYVPGVSSFYSAAGNNSIPLTHRGISTGFWVVSGVSKEKKIPEEITQAAKTQSTVVVLMPFLLFSEIISEFLKYRNENTPVALIQDATLPNEKMITGTLKTIEELRQKKHVYSPATLLIGDVVGLSNQKSKKNESVVSYFP